MTPQTMVLENGDRITVVHLAVHVEADGLVVGESERIACAPKMDDLTAKDRTAPVLRSGDPRTINCPLCRKTPQYADAMRMRPVKRTEQTVLVHFAVPTENDASMTLGDTTYRLACHAVTAALDPRPSQRTNDCRFVSCPACQATEEYKEAMEAIRNIRRRHVQAR